MTVKNPKAAKNPENGHYQDPSCAYCPPSVRACRQGEDRQRGPGFCPSRVAPEAIDDAFEHYAEPFVRKVAQESARVESEGYCRWTRVEEICAFARRMGFKKIGIATCISFVDQAYTLSGILESHGFEVASTACKHGSVAKEEICLKDSEKIRALFLLKSSRIIEIEPVSLPASLDPSMVVQSAGRIRQPRRSRWGSSWHSGSSGHK